MRKKSLELSDEHVGVGTKCELCMDLRGLYSVRFKEEMGLAHHVIFWNMSRTDGKPGANRYVYYVWLC